MVSKEFENLKKFLKQGKLNGDKKRVEEERKNLEQVTSRIPHPKDIEIERFSIENIACAWFTLPISVHKNVIFYLHGGGYVAGSIDTNIDLATRIARASNSRVLFFEYHLAPENPFPSALEDAFIVYNWLINTENIDPKNVIFFGESAGGGLAVATLVKLKDLGKTLPAAAVLLSPWTDLDFTGESIKKNAHIDPFITLDAMVFYSRLYIGRNDPRNPYISPLYADLKGLPPLLIHVGAAELLLDDSRRLAEKAKICGVHVTLKIWDEMIHVFHAFAGWIPEGKRAIKEIGEFVSKILEKKK